ncbi:DUF3347 domain-containing protein [Mucilaginibacter robiniae]|uniref:DUF3347 domain-containing protein n=1 Tax=Mucilaginibacter robiniae TaxID=2728022 RepID=A0A7L5E0Q9_9SPHI|nr:DUF3347 domain-containing protein [Mucilaginibacter robiniae]QJD96088.1 DUF3347 domain-containing protein [Mucilaginibacter robiniae]
MKKVLKTVTLTISLFAAVFAAKAQPATPDLVTPAILSNYYELKDALAADNSTLAQVKAKALLNAVETFNATLFTAEQQRIWSSYTDKLQFDSRHISESTALDHQREHFASLSKSMFAVLKSLKLNSAPVYEQYCPMRKATWLSESADIKNPYYGKQMLNCGKTTETLPVAK